MVCYVPQQRVGVLCGLVGEFGVTFNAFVGWRSLMLFGYVEFQLLRSVAGKRREGDI